MTAPQPPQINMVEIIEAVPAVVMRLSRQDSDWRVWFVTGNISQYGYDRDDLLSDRVKWFDLIHPDDQVCVSKRISDYEALNIDSFRLHYRLLAQNGDSVPVTEHNTVRRRTDGEIYCYDTVIVNSSQAELEPQNEHARRQLVLNDILMSLHESDLDHALRIVLDRTGVYLDTSRVLLFQDNSIDHTNGQVVYEWCNTGISSARDHGYSPTYGVGRSEFYAALRDTGEFLINADEIPPNCRSAFEKEGLAASAIFAVYLHGEPYGFVRFDDCVVERRWDAETARFLKKVSNLTSTVLARQKAARELEASRKATQTVLDNVDSYIFTIEPGSDRIIFANKAFKDTFGEDCEGRDCGDFLHIRPEADVQAGPGRLREFLPDAYCEETNQWLGLDTETVEWADGRQVVLVTCSDVTVNKLYAEAVEHQTFIDYLTKLPNRYRCDMILPEVMAEAAQSGSEGCLLMIDLDDFRRINNRWGHDYGDDLLLNIAAYLRETFPELNKVFRFGGDEFVVLINHLESRWVDEFINELLQRSAHHWPAIDQEFQCTFSIGAVKFSGLDHDHRSVLRRADLAMYDAKKQGKNRARFYDEGLESDDIAGLNSVMPETSTP